MVDLSSLVHIDSIKLTTAVRYSHNNYCVCCLILYTNQLYHYTEKWNFLSRELIILLLIYTQPFTIVAYIHVRHVCMCYIKLRIKSLISGY